MQNHFSIVSTALLLVGLSLQVVQAELPKLFAADSSPLDLARFLFSQNDGFTTRSFNNQPARNIAAMKIEFQFDSANLTSEATESIDVLAPALMPPVAINGRVLIEGHTDSIGTKEHNLLLSKRRADAVKQYLMIEHGINGDRLFIKGKGGSELLNPLNPSGGVNRRVQFMEIL